MSGSYFGECHWAFSSYWKKPRPIGESAPINNSFFVIFHTGWIFVIAAGNDTMWVRLCLVLGKAELTTDPRFCKNSSRTDNWDALESLLSQTLREKTTEEWLRVLDMEGIPCAPINNIEQVMADPHIRAREMIVEVEHPIAGKVKLPGVPIKFSRTPCKVVRPSPCLGDHNTEILDRLEKGD